MLAKWLREGVPSRVASRTHLKRATGCVAARARPNTLAAAPRTLLIRQTGAGVLLLALAGCVLEANDC